MKDKGLFCIPQDDDNELVVAESSLPRILLRVGWDGGRIWGGFYKQPVLEAP